MISHVPVKDILGCDSGDFPGQDIEEWWGEKYCDFSDDFLFSILEDGVINPILVEDNTILEGHHRLVAALLCGLEKIPVISNLDDYLNYIQSCQFVKSSLELPMGWSFV